MTDKKLDQILRQALTPDIDETEIMIRRKSREQKVTKVNLKKTIAGGVAACAALALIVTATNFGGISEMRGGNSSDNTSGNYFAITANAAEISDNVSSGDVISISTEETYGSGKYLSGRFQIAGQNIASISIETDKCDIYTSVPIYEGDEEFKIAQNAELNGDADENDTYEMIIDTLYDEERAASSEPLEYHYDHLSIVGNVYEGEYNDKMSFGLSVPEELMSKNDDMQTAYHEDVDQVDGATLIITATFTDGSTEEHHYLLNTGKIYVPTDEDGNNVYDNLTRFLTSEEEKDGETGYVYGYLFERID